MLIKDYLGRDVIGQPRSRKACNFFINGQRENGFLPILFLNSQKGRGKSFIGREIARNLLCEDKKTIKPLVECNGASFKNLTSFIDNVINVHCSNNQEISVILDEFHCLEKDIQNWLLNVIQPTNDNISRVSFSGVDYVFSFNRLSIITCSTSPEKMSEAMKSRLTKVELDPYSENDLIKILRKNSRGVFYFGEIEKEIIPVVRNSPRSTVKMAQNIIQYCRQSKTETFNEDNWNELKGILGIRPLGLTGQELELLSYLNETGPKSLTCVSAKMGLSSTSVRLDVELFLISNDLIVIDGRRMITPKGKKLLKSILAD